MADDVPDPRSLHAALADLYERALADARVRTEFQRARREFFGDVDREHPVGANPAAELRFVEWVMLERDCVQFAAVPIDVLDGGLGAEAASDLRESMVGAFLVESAAGDRAQARDLQDQATLELQAPAGALRAGDLVVGRLFPGELDGWIPSPAIALHRPGHQLSAAFGRDLARLALDRRLSQVELEHLLLRRPEPAPKAVRPIEHLEADLDAVLRAGGADGIAAEVSESLANSPRPSAVIGPLLEQLAFDTDVDLDRARRALVELWNAQHHDELAAAEVAAAAAAAPDADDAPVADDEPTAEGLGQRLVRMLDEGLAQQRDVGELFQQIEAMAGIEPDDDDDDDLGEVGASALAAAFEVGDVGNLGPLVTEFVWETDQGGSEVEATLQLWVGLQQNAPLPHANLEEVTGQDLMRLLLHVYLRAAPQRRAAEVRAAHAALQQFAGWAADTQELSLQDALAACQGALLEHVDRLQEASVRLSGSSAPAAGATADAQPILLRVEDVDPKGFGVRSDAGSHWIAVEPETAALLRPTDLVLGTLRTGGRSAALGGLVVVLPGDAESLMG
ncbi:MAG: hypothetical protein AB7O97_20595 [Planctomycetota bacterium]